MNELDDGRSRPKYLQAGIHTQGRTLSRNGAIKDSSVVDPKDRIQNRRTVWLLFLTLRLVQFCFHCEDHLEPRARCRCRGRAVYCPCLRPTFTSPWKFSQYLPPQRISQAGYRDLSLATGSNELAHVDGDKHNVAKSYESGLLYDSEFGWQYRLTALTNRF